MDTNMNQNASNNDDNVEYEVIRLDEIEPITKPDCKHFFVKDDDEIGDNQAWICQGCKRGVFYPKGVTIVNS
jgi:hypothetical protein